MRYVKMANEIFYNGIDIYVGIYCTITLRFLLSATFMLLMVATPEDFLNFEFFTKTKPIL